jgi:hypothetical protein
MILENQGRKFGYVASKDSLEVMDNFIEMYNPTSKTWRSKVMNDTYSIMELAVERY